MKIIAEAGCNWRTLKEAREFIRRSKALGLFATKFQLYNEDIIKDTPDYNFLKYIMLDYEKAKELFEYGKSINQEVFFTPMYLEAVEWCKQLNVKYIKVRCNEKTEISVKVKNSYIPFFISLEFGYSIAHYVMNCIPLVCVPKYPARFEDYLPDLTDITKLNEFRGVSDHTPDLRLFKEVKNDFTNSYYWEKHMKLDGTTPLEDKWSVSFKELEEVLDNEV